MNCMYACPPLLWHHHPDDITIYQRLILQVDDGTAVVYLDGSAGNSAVLHSAGCAPTSDQDRLVVSEG